MRISENRCEALEKRLVPFTKLVDGRPVPGTREVYERCIRTVHDDGAHSFVHPTPFTIEVRQ